MAVSMNKVELLDIQLEEIASATNNFNHSNCIGGGGFGKVYEGALPQFKEHNMVAIKRLDRIHGQGDAEYLKEITMLSRYTHENLISLLGFCKQGTEMILVYEHASRSSLDKHLNSADLTWKQRVKICLGAAKGLNYLHDPRETSQRLIHCDIKSANILLDDEWNAKVADFGLSKIAPANPQNSMLVTSALGTVGYCDPLFLETYELTKESDVYSFGVVLFEVLCGKVCTRTRNGQLQVLVHTWKKSYEEKKLDEIMCPNLRQNMDWNSLEIFSDIAFQCLKRTREERPTMSLVVEKLETALGCLRLKPPKEYEEIVKAAVPPLICESIEELMVLLSKGFFVNDGKTWFSINDEKEHILLISIEECLMFSIFSWGRQYSHEFDSSFKVGTYDTHGDKFKTRVTPPYLSPCTTYVVNLIFKCPKVLEEKSWKQRHMSLTFTFLNLREKRRSIVYIHGKSKYEWLRARLHQFTTTSDPSSSIKDLEFNFEDHEYGLQIEGIELQQLNVNAEELKADIDENKYQKILKSAKPRLMYTSVKELDLDHLLSKGLLVNRDNTRLSINDNKEHIQLRSIKKCLILNYREDVCDRYSFEYNSRFEVATYNTRGEKFKTRVTTKLLSPCTTYFVNLIFKCPKLLKEKSGEQYIFLTFELLNLGEERRTVVYIGGKSEDEWLRARLHQFTTTRSIEDLKFNFKDHEYRLEIEGIEFQQLKVNVGELKADIDKNKYHEILKSTNRLMYTSVKELNLDLILSKGLLVNRDKTWFHLNDKGQHCELISIEQCLIPDSKESYHHYTDDCNSRFPVGTLSALSCDFKVRVKAQFLTPLITYTVNLVFKFRHKMESQSKQPSLNLKYKVKVEGMTKTSYTYFIDKREDGWWMAELCHITSEQGTTTADFQIIFQGNDPWIVVEGIDFLPLELDHVQQPISSYSGSVDTYWVQKLPNDYEHVIKLAKDSVPMNATKQELYLILSKGFLINDGQEWLSVDKNGKKRLMLSPRKACEKDTWGLKWQPLPESRFGETVELRSKFIIIDSRINYELLSSETTYATYLVYKLPESDQSKFEYPIQVMDGTGLDSSYDDTNYWFVFLISPQTPIINVRGKVGENTYNPVNRPKIKGIPQKRSDGWMEVQVYEIRTPTSTTTTTNQLIHMRLQIKMPTKGPILQGIELRPIYIG